MNRYLLFSKLWSGTLFGREQYSVPSGAVLHRYIEQYSVSSGAVLCIIGSSALYHLEQCSIGSKPVLSLDGARFLCLLESKIAKLQIANNFTQIRLEPKRV